MVDYVFLSNKCNEELQMLEAKNKTWTSKAISDMLRHKWHNPIEQPGPTQSLIQVCCHSVCTKRTAGRLHANLENITGIVLTLMDFPFWVTILTWPRSTNVIMSFCMGVWIGTHEWLGRVDWRPWRSDGESRGMKASAIKTDEHCGTL